MSRQTPLQTFLGSNKSAGFGSEVVGSFFVSEGAGAFSTLVDDMVEAGVSQFLHLTGRQTHVEFIWSVKLARTCCFRRDHTGKLSAELAKALSPFGHVGRPVGRG